MVRAEISCAAAASVGKWPEALSQTAVDRLDEWLIGVVGEKIAEAVGVDRRNDFEQLRVCSDSVDGVEVLILRGGRGRQWVRGKSRINSRANETFGTVGIVKQ